MIGKGFLIYVVLVMSFTFCAGIEKGSENLATASETSSIKMTKEENKTATEDKSLPEIIPAGTNVRVKLNETEEVEFEIKPNSISREQLLRFRKFLSRKGFVLKNADFDSEEGSEDLTKRKIGEYNGKEGINPNVIEESGKKKYPEKLSEVTAEDILPLLPQNLTSIYPHIFQLKNEKCQKQALYFLQGLHNLTNWAVQSKSYIYLLISLHLSFALNFDRFYLKKILIK